MEDQQVQLAPITNAYGTWLWFCAWCGCFWFSNSDGDTDPQNVCSGCSASGGPLFYYELYPEDLDKSIDRLSYRIPDQLWNKHGGYPADADWGTLVKDVPMRVIAEVTPSSIDPASAPR